MRREVIGTGETVEAAREAACRELGVQSEEAEFEILEMPVRKTLGLFGGSPAKVRVFVEESPADKAASYLHSVLCNLGLTDVQIEIQEEENSAMLSITGGDVGFIIGHRGETLDALQYLAGLVANHTEDTYYRITLDIGNYREKRRETLEALGKKLAAKAVKSGRNNSLEPMNPYERRIIHTAVQEIEGATSWSEGQDQARHVVIGPEGGERFQPRRPGGRRPYSNTNNSRRPGGDFHQNRNGGYHSGPRQSGGYHSSGSPRQGDYHGTQQSAGRVNRNSFSEN